jgi:hypothetical protein
MASTADLRGHAVLDANRCDSDAIARGQGKTKAD